MTHLTSFIRHVLSFSLIVLNQHIAAQEGPQGTCLLTETCKCKYENDYTVDLTPLASENGPRFTYVNYEDFNFDVNLCSEFSIGGCYDVTVCQESAEGAFSYGCGRMANAYFTVQNGDLNYYFIGGEDGRSSKIKLVCDENEDAKMEAFGDTTQLEYDFTLTSKYACALAPGDDPIDPPGGSGGSISLSVGSILLIVCFGALIAYFIVGALIMKFGMHAEGKEIVPQSGFWTAIPGLIKEGGQFIRRKICGGGGGDAGNYEKL
eukprot:m.307321 g.307321  ORF g.307321 m.307321 type:complete len:263 (+) comp42146_c0_seq1:69-857(+)